MVVHGVKVVSNIPFPLDLPSGGDYRYEISLRASVPQRLRESITCGTHLYNSHNRRIHFYTDRLLDGIETEQPFCFEVAEVIRFYWRHGEKTVYFEMLEQGDDALLAFWFLHTLLPLFMTFENLSVLFHSGAVEVDGDAVAFIAPSTGGKSTMTDYFLKRGHALVTDDILSVWPEADRVMCSGSFPYHRPFRAPETLGYRTENFHPLFRPLKALYLLEKGSPDSEVLIGEVRGFRKFEQLKRLGIVYTFRFMTLTHNEILSHLLNRVAVYRVTRPWDMDRIDEVYEAIRSHAEKL